MTRGGLSVHRTEHHRKVLHARTSELKTFGVYTFLLIVFSIG